MSLLNSIRTIEVNGDVLYMAGDVGKALGIRNIRNRNMCERVLCDFTTKGGCQQVYFLTLKGFKQILFSCRKPNVIHIANELGISLIDTKIVPIETSTIHCIIETFKNHIMTDQYNINGKRIDLYFPKYKIAIECDEMHHSKQQEQDTQREIMITSCLDCSFIRYRPYDKDFNIFNLIGVIHEAILKANK